MKDWKFLQVGNTKTGNYESSTQRPDSKIYQTIHEFIKTSGGDADKAFVAIKRKYPNLTDEFIEKSIDEVIRTNKAGNESIDKQEWSLYQGLKKDAEKEIGNETYQHKLYPDKYVIINGKNYKIITDGKVEKTGELTDAILYGINQTYKRVSSMNSKTGNQSAQDKFLDDINGIKAKYKQEGKEINLSRLMYELKRIGWAESDFTKLKWPANIGNETPEEMEVKYKGYNITYFPYQKKYMVRHPNEVSGLMQKHFTSVDEAKKAIDKKVGNGTPGSIASIGPAWMHGGTVYGKMNTDESGKRHNEYVKITWLGEGKGGVANYFIDDRMQSDKFGSLDKNELKRWAEQKVGNAQWSRSYYKEKIDPSKWSEFEREFDKLNQRHIEEKTLAEQDGKRPDFEKQKREADMVVKKYALNNLKRARNAMNKKCGNAQITLWNGNDTVLISEDGTVQYLESNSFEVGKDKYDRQQMAIEEMTKKGYRKK